MGPCHRSSLLRIHLGGAVNTIEFYQYKKAYDRHDQNHFLEAYDWVKEGFKKRNLSYICKAATISARVNQKILPKPFFNEFENLAYACQGGSVTAHSGTVVGILIDKELPKINEVVIHLSRQMSILFKNLDIKHFYYFSERENCQLF